MAISRISSATGTNTATLGTHAAGDLILVFAYRDGNTTAPSLASGFTNIQASGSNTNSARMGWKIAASGSETVGTWTNATSVIAVVYRGADGIGGSAITGGASTTISYPALTMQVTDGSSWVVGAAGHRSTNVAIETAPSGMTNVTSVSDATDEAAWHDTNAGVTSWSAASASVGGTSSGWRSITVELIAATAPTLSAQTVDLVSSTSGTPKVTTNNASGTLYMVCVPDGDSPSVSQIKAGQNSSGSAAINAQNQTVTSTGQKAFSTVTGLTTDVPYDFWFVHTNSVGDSSAVKADFTPVEYPDYTPTWKTAGTATGWTNSGNTTASDDTYATTSVTGWLTAGAELQLSNFDFALPAGLNPTSIDIEIEGYWTGSTPNSNISAVYLVKDTGASIPAGGASGWSTLQTYISTTEGTTEINHPFTVTIGGAPLSSWSLSDFNSSTCGLKIQCESTQDNFPSGGTTNYFIDRVRVRINDTPPAAPQYGSTLFWAFP